MKLTVMSLVLVFSLFVVQPVFCEHEEILAEEGIDPAQAQMLTEGQEIDSYDAAMLLEKLEGNEDKINAFMESSGVPASLKGFTSGRYNIHIGEETVGIVMEDGKLGEVAEGGVENPTTDIYADEELIEKIATSEDPMGTIIEAQKTGELKKEDHGLVPKIKGFLMSIVLKILDLVS